MNSSSKLIIIRGNSGSGKSTIAHRVRSEMGDKVMLLQQDVLRRDILKVEDREGNPVIGLIEQLAMYGKSLGYDVLLEGILSKKKYGSLLEGLMEKFDESFVYYFDLSFEETLRRHGLRDQRTDFDESKLREWWLEDDTLDIRSEHIFGDSMSEKQITQKIIDDIA
ncbi:kinase [Candidatus Saccharibacteria bacterium]|nr:kinase [Candidatus Saccharibacteria bacterium]